MAKERERTLGDVVEAIVSKVKEYDKIHRTHVGEWMLTTALRHYYKSYGLEVGELVYIDGYGTWDLNHKIDDKIVEESKIYWAGIGEDPFGDREARETVEWAFN